MPSAIGKSRPVLAFGMSAGARFAVIFWRGKEKPELTMAERIRSRLSMMDLLGMPTILKFGSPWLALQSISIKKPSGPKGIADCVFVVFMGESIRGTDLKVKHEYVKIRTVGADKA